jgi:tRNA U34 5-carboxymethylaminomethyl modifying GTPase MnmE/TrmE
MEIGMLMAIASLVAAIAGPAIAFGVMKHKAERNAEQEGRIDKCATREELRALKCATREELRALEKRTDEDRERNLTAHKDMYASLNRHEATISEIRQILAYMQQSLDEVKKSIDKGFDRLDREIKGLERRA